MKQVLLNIFLVLALILQLLFDWFLLDRVARIDASAACRKVAWSKNLYFCRTQGLTPSSQNATITNIPNSEQPK